MKALIFSDSHGMVGNMIDVIMEHKDINLIIHAGDMQRDVDDIMNVFPEIPCAYVTGNNEYYNLDIPVERLFEFGGKRIFLTHGHRYGVKGSPARVIAEARKRGADVCIFGHTHSKLLNHQDIWVINPGPAGRSYGVMTIADGEIEIEIKEYE